MSDELSRWVVVCEAREDFETATGLADRVILEKIDWAEDILKDLRIWGGVEGSADFTKWTSIKGLASKHGVKVHGKFGRGHFRGGAVEARKALAVVDKAERDVSAVVLVRDSDGHAERIDGFNEARRMAKWPWEVVIALPHPELESWLLAGFEPRSSEEQRNLKELHRELGYDPRTKADELKAGAENDDRGRPIKHSSKRILDEITGGDGARRRGCWSECALETLRERGDASGFSDYLQEVAERLVPIMRSGPCK